MSNEIQTFCIDDYRISGITDQISVAVKKGPSSSVMQSYKQISNSTSNILFNVNVPSENTLVNRNIKVNAVLRYTATFGANTTGNIIKVSPVPASFPMNTALSNATCTINNSKVSVQSQDVCEILKKQYTQEFLSHHVQTTPVYVDKYWASIEDAGTDEFPSSYMSGVKYAEKDTNISGRADTDMTVSLFSNVNAIVANNEIPIDAPAGFYVDIVLNVSEPLLGLPCFELKDDEACFLGVNNLELNLLLNDCKRCFYFNSAAEGLISSRSPGSKFPGPTSTSNFFSDETKLTVQYITLHASDYGKLSQGGMASGKNAISYNEFIPYKTATSITLADASTTLTSQQIQMRQIPDKIYISVFPQYSTMPTTLSNHLSFPITNIAITFNNRANLLSEMNVYDLYNMSMRNGNHQSYNEFRGVVRDLNGDQYMSLGSIVVIDPRDLSLDDYLASGSIGTFSFQAQITVGKLHDISHFGTNANVNANVSVIASYGGVFITQQGSSAAMSGLLTKALVLETKDQGNSIGDYEQVSEMQGGNIGRSLTGLSNVLKKHGKSLLKNASIAPRSSAVPMAANRLSKYM